MTAVRRRVTHAEERSDAELLGLAHAGDREALGALYDRHAQSVYAYARRFTTSAEAEDVVQATFVRLPTIAGTFDARALGARGWIFGVAHRVLAERRRSLQRFARAMSRYSESWRGAASIEPPADGPDLERALASLSEPKREVLVLTLVHGFSCDEVARMLELPVGTVWTRLHHARRHLRIHLEVES